MSIVTTMLMVWTVVAMLTDHVQPECSVGEYTKSDGTCGNCYYYCVTCDGVAGFYNCPNECGCFNNYTGDCDLRNCGGCLSGYNFHNDGYCKCENSQHCCGAECQTCGAPGQCKECVRGRYGPLCLSRCSDGCLRCDDLGRCIECEPGKFGDTCSEDCREECIECTDYDNCTSCITGNFGTNCSQTCRDECVTCTGYDNCTPCIERRFGDKCENSCRENCITCEDNDNCTECIDGKYDQRCESDCEGGCKRCVIQYGSYVCKECHPGRYGYNCEYACDDRCRDKICDKAHGYCQNGCIDGYYLGSNRRTCYKCPSTCTKCSNSDNCTECNLWRYGWRCTQQCLGCIDGVCDLTGGQCELGCKDGYYNSSGKCFKCPINCLNCTDASFCTSCVTGKFGRTCESMFENVRTIYVT